MFEEDTPVIEEIKADQPAGYQMELERWTNIGYICFSNLSYFLHF
jgi:hypothetical protein